MACLPRGGEGVCLCFRGEKGGGMKISALSQTKVGQFCVERKLIYSTEQELQGWKEGGRNGGRRREDEEPHRI